MTDTFKEFEQLLELAADLHGKRVGGTRLGIITNAGYEAVGMADAIRGARYEVQIADLGNASLSRLSAVLDEGGLASLVNAGNPLDLTPMADDAAYEACVRLMLDDDAVDAVIVGCVPMTPGLSPTPEEIHRPGSIAARLAGLAAESAKPLVFVVDCRAPYHELAQRVRRAGVPVFRSADQAVRSLGRYLNHCHAHPVRLESSAERLEAGFTHELEAAMPQESRS